MDPLTHTSVGMILGQAGLKRLTPNWGWIVFFAASVPDIDVLPFREGIVEVLDWHRHFTHALLFAPLMALSVVLGVKYVLRRHIEFRGAWILATVAVVAHDLTDFLTYRGSRLFLPFSDSYYALHIESFIDPIVYTLLFFGLAMPMLSRLVSGEIGGKHSSGAWAARIALALCMVWLFGRYSFRDQAIAEMNSRVYEGVAPKRVDAIPNINPLIFSGLVDAGSFIKTLEVNLLEYFDPEDAQTYFQPAPDVEAGKALKAASAARSVQIFQAWARWPRWRVNRNEGNAGWVVIVEELATDKLRSRARVIVKMNDRYEILSEVYERGRTGMGL